MKGSLLPLADTQGGWESPALEVFKDASDTPVQILPGAGTQSSPALPRALPARLVHGPVGLGLSHPLASLGIWAPASWSKARRDSETRGSPSALGASRSSEMAGEAVGSRQGEVQTPEQGLCGESAL